MALKAARGLGAHRKRHCTKGSRKWRKHGRRAGKLRRRCHQVQEEWERHTAKDIVTGTGMVGREALKTRNLMASGRGTASAPGSRGKRGLNEAFAQARLAKLFAAVDRRALRMGCHSVAVHPANTSITCNACGRKDKESRRSQAEFVCTACGHKVHADVNAGRNIRDRARNVLNAVVARREADRRLGTSSAPKGRRPKGRATAGDGGVNALRAAPVRGQPGSEKGMTEVSSTGPP